MEKQSTRVICPLVSFSNSARGLNTTDVLVYIVGQHSKTGSIHQINYGGVYWYDLTDKSISVFRPEGDLDWDEVRIMIWRIS